MSKVIDTRVVEMQFDNSKFNNRIADSRSALSAFDKQISGLSTDPLTKGLNVSIEGFSKMQAVALGALQRIGERAADAGLKMVKSLSVDNINAGWNKYAENTKNTATLLAQGFEESEVEKTLEKLLWFTDETSYKYTEMVDSISKFTAAGQGLEESADAMMGIANWAALSGQNSATAARAMFQLSQAVSAGALRREDYKSIQTANMDTQAFRKTLIAAGVAMGTLKQVSNDTWVTVQDGINGVKKAGIEVTVSNMVDTLTDTAWASTDVMMPAFTSFAQSTQEIFEYVEEHGVTTAEAIYALGKDLDDFSVNAFLAAQEARTFDDAIDAVKEAVGTGFMKMFEQLFGKAKESIKIWSEFCQDLYEIFMIPVDGALEILKVWNEFNGRQSMLRSFRELFASVQIIIETIQNASEEVFGTAEQNGRLLYKITSNIASSMVKLTKYLEDNSDKIANIFEGAFKVIQTIGKVATKLFVKPMAKFLSTVLGGSGDVLDTVENIFDVITKILDSEEFERTIDAISNGLVFIADIAGKVVKTLLTFLTHDAFKRVGIIIRDVVKALTDKDFGSVLKTLIGNGGGLIGDLVKRVGELLGFDLTGFGDTVTTVFTKIGDVLAPVADFLASIVGGLVYVFGKGFAGAKENGFSGFFQGMSEGLSDVVSQIVDLIYNLTGYDLRGLTDNISNFFVSVGEGIKNIRDTGILDNLGKTFKGFFKSIETWFGSLGESKDGEQTTIIGSVIQSIKNMTDGTNGEDIKNNITTFFKNVGEGLANGLDPLIAWVTQLDVDDLIRILDAVELIFAHIEGIVMSVYFTKSMQGFATAMKNIGNITGDIQKNTLPKLETMFGSFTTLAQGMTDKLKGKNFNDRLKSLAILVGAFAGFVLSIAGALYILDKINFDTLIVGGFFLTLLVQEITSTVRQLGMIANDKALSANAFIGMGVIIHTLAESMVAFAGALWIIDRLDPAKALVGGIALFGLIEELMYIVQRLSKLDISPKKLEAIAIAMGIASGVFLVIAGSIWVIGQIPTDSIGAAATSLFVLMAEVFGGLAGIIYMLKKYHMQPESLNKISKSIVLASAVFGVIAGSIATIASTTSPETLIPIAVSLGALFGEVAGVLALFAQFKGINYKSLMQLGIAMDILSGVFITVAASLAIVGAVLAHGVSVKQLLGVAVILAGMFAVLGIGLLGLVAVADYIGNSGAIVYVEALAAALLMLSVAVAAVGVGIGAATAGIGYLVKNVTEFFKMVHDLGEDGPVVFKTVIDAVIYFVHEMAAQIPFIAEQIGLAFVSLFKVISDNQNAILKSLDVIGAIVTAGLDLVIPLIIHAIERILIGLLEAINNIVPQLGKVILNIIAEVSRILSNGVPTLVSAIIIVLETILVTLLPEVVRIVFDALEKLLYLLADEVPQLFTAALHFITAVFKMIVDAAKSIDFALLVDALTSMGELTAILALVGITGPAAYLGLAMMTKVMIGLLGVMVVASTILTYLPNLATFLERGIPLLSALAKGFGAVVGAFMGAFLGEMSSGMILVADNLNLFMEKMSPFLESLKTVDDEALSAASKLSAIITILAGSQMLEGFSSLFNFSFSTDKENDFAGRMAKLAEGVVEFSRIITEGKVDTYAVKRGAEATKTLAEACAKIPNDGGGLGLLMGNNNAGDFGDSLRELGDGLLAFYLNVVQTNSDVIKDGADALASIVEVTNDIPKMGGFTWLLEGDQHFAEFGDSLWNLGHGLNAFYYEVLGVNPEVIKMGAEAVGYVVDVAKQIPNTGLSLASIAAGDNDIATFGNMLPILGKGIHDFGVEMLNVDVDAVRSGARAASAFAKCAQDIPNVGGVASWFAGDNAIDAFGEKLPVLGAGIRGFYVETLGVDATAVRQGALSLKRVVDACADIHNDDGIFAKFTGSNDGKTFGNNLGILGEGLSAFSENVTGLSTTAIENACVALESLTAFLKTAGGTDYGEILIDIGMYIGGFGDSLFTLSQTANGIKWKAIDSAIAYGKKCVEFIDDIRNVDFTKPLKFGDMFLGLAKAKVEDFIGEFSKNKGRLMLVVSDFIDAIEQAVKQKNLSIANTGAKIVTTLIDGMNLKKESASKAAHGIAESVVTEFRYFIDTTNEFYKAGSDAIQGYIDGLNSQNETVAATSKELANKTLHKVRETLDVRSPSRKMREIGVYTGQGFAYGMIDSVGIVADAAYTMSDEALNNMSTAIAAASEMAEDDENAYPVITPIIDLSEVQNGFSEIDRMSNLSDLSVRASQTYSQHVDPMAEAFDRMSNAFANNQQPSPTINITINGAEGQDVNELADAVVDKINNLFIRGKAVYGV